MRSSGDNDHLRTDAGVEAEPIAPLSHRAAIARRVRALIEAIRDGDEHMVEDAVHALSRSRRILAPLAFAVGAFVMLFDGVKLLVFNWRLTLVQLLPAMWIWIAMFDLKAHTFRGASFRELSAPALTLTMLAIIVITAASFFWNAVFAFAIATPPPPTIRPALNQARSHLVFVLGSGAAVGVLLALSAVVVPRWGDIWFAICMSAVIGIMTFCYVAVPSRLLGVTSTRSRRDKLAASAIGGALGAIVCAPPYLLARIGILMLGSSVLFLPGLLLLTLGVTLQAGATGAVKAIKMSATLMVGPAHNTASPT